MEPQKLIVEKQPGRLASGFMSVLLAMARGFVIFCGVTPPKPEQERKFAVFLFVLLCLLILAFAAFLLVAASGVVVMK